MKVTKTKPTAKKSGNDFYIYLGAALLIGGVAYTMNKKTVQEVEPENATPTPPSNSNVSTPLNPNLILKLGSKGKEVAKLQSMMGGISSDGIFGAKTESRLFELKRVKSVSINGYSKIATAPPLTKVIFAPGTKVMVKNSSGAKMYLAEKKANGVYFSTGKAVKTFAYGEHIGIVQSPSIDGQSHAITFKSFWHGDFLYDNAVGFVSTNDIQKY